MPVLARAKLRVGRAIDSSALVADAKESLACAWLAAAALGGLVLHGTLGWWWADPAAALAMVPFLVREGREALEESRGEPGACGCHDE
jgi:divalent metal cation (Fe/Co/Zn/Cd) transporter